MSFWEIMVNAKPDTILLPERAGFASAPGGLTLFMVFVPAQNNPLPGRPHARSNAVTSALAHDPATIPARHKS